MREIGLRKHKHTSPVVEEHPGEPGDVGRPGAHHREAAAKVYTGYVSGGRRRDTGRNQQTSGLCLLQFLIAFRIL